MTTSDTERMDLDTFNKFLVAAQGDRLVILRQPIPPLDRTDALTLAAWLVVMGDRQADHADFVRLVEEIENS